jgi:hypothetical protein
VAREFPSVECSRERGSDTRDDAWQSQACLLFLGESLQVATDGSRRIKLCFVNLFYIFVHKRFRQLILGYNRGNIV